MYSHVLVPFAIIPYLLENVQMATFNSLAFFFVTQITGSVFFKLIDA